MVIQERYNPLPIGTNATVQIYGNNIGGFLCVTAGTLTVTANANDGKAAFTLFSALPVSAGVYYPLPFYLSKTGGTATTAGGASGTLGV